MLDESIRYLNIFTEVNINRGNNNALVRNSDGTRINENIKEKEVRLIDETGDNKGVVSITFALEAAADAGLDLIEISPQVSPPVCKILDYGKYRYEMQKRRNEAKKNQKTISIKEIKMRPNIDTHDYEVKLNQAKKFLKQGDKVKFTLRFRGRETPPPRGENSVLDDILLDLEGLCKVDSFPKFEGRQMTMLVSSEQ